MLAQDPLDPVRRQVQAWLLETLDKPGLILIEYTYNAGVWGDSSLGCPVTGVTYTPGTVQGYRWTFLYNNFVRYEVHTGLNGDPIVLCTATNTASDTPLGPSLFSCDYVTEIPWLECRALVAVYDDTNGQNAVTGGTPSISSGTGTITFETD